MRIILRRFLVVPVVALTLVAFIAASPAQASLANAKASSTTVQTIPLSVNCNSAPNTAHVHQFFAAHHLCGYGTASMAGPIRDGSVSGNCGSLTNWISNLGGGNANNHVRITAVWWFGPIANAIWGGDDYNWNDNYDVLLGDYLPGPYGFSVDDYESAHTYSGPVTFTVGYAADTNFLGVTCQNAASVVAETTIT
jgi:hypothetical protein